MSKLTTTKIRALSKPGMHADGGTLYLNIAKRGAKSWIQRIVVDGKRRDIGLGPWPVVTLDEAREKAFVNRRKVYQGRNPLLEKRRSSMPTFREAAVRKYSAKQFRNDKARKNWIQRMEKRVFPAIGGMSVDRITRADVLNIIEPIWTKYPETARKLRQHIRETLDWCQAREYIEHNAAGEGIDGALPQVPRTKAHFRALPHGDVKAALETVEQSPATATARLCFRFVVLTACRSGEVRGALRSEVDMDARVWTIPAERMKAKVEHRVPLSGEAIDVLGHARALDDGSGLIFPSPRSRGKPMSDMTLTKILRTAGLAEHTTVHGFRSSFRNWCADTNRPRELAEAALAHTVGGVEGAYLRSDILERRRVLMQQWADYLSGRPAKVVTLATA